MRCAIGKAPSRQEKLPNGGFTLTEIVLALVILGALATMAAPRFFEQSGFDERLFRDDALAALRYAQKLAVATGCQVQVSVASDAYTLVQRSACDSGSFDRAVAHPGTGAASYTNQAPSGVSFSSDVSPIVFDALGRARTSGGAVTDVSLGVGARAIEIVGETGLVRSL